MSTRPPHIEQLAGQTVSIHAEALQAVHLYRCGPEAAVLVADVPGGGELVVNVVIVTDASGRPALSIGAALEGLPGASTTPTPSAQPDEGGGTVLPFSRTIKG